MILAVTLAVIAQAQVVNRDNLIGKTFVNGDGLCSTYFRFIDSTLFLRNAGCEGPGHTNYGTYTTKEDTVIFTDGIDLSSVKINHVDTTRSSIGDSLILQFYNQYNQNISSFFRGKYKIGESKIYSISYDSTFNALLYRRIKYNDPNIHYDIEISTFKNLGLNLPEISSDYEGTLKIQYFLTFPDIVIDYQLYNRDIARSGNSYSYLYKDFCLVPIKQESGFFHDSDIRFCEVKH